MGLSARRAALVALPVAAIAAALIAVLGGSGASSAQPASKVSSGTWPPAKIKSLTHLSPLPAKTAPGFTLTDQNGRRVSLSSLRGKVVVMQPMDPECTDICPVVAQEFIDAARTLGAKAAQVVFLGVNVNQDHEGLASVRKFSREHNLAKLAGWHFLTGPTRALRRVWHDYQVTVEINKAGEVTHTSQMYFIDPQGRWRWVALPQVEKLAIPRWGDAIAAVAEHLMGARS